MGDYRTQSIGNNYSDSVHPVGVTVQERNNIEIRSRTIGSKCNRTGKRLIIQPIDGIALNRVRDIHHRNRIAGSSELYDPICAISAGIGNHRRYIH